MVNFVEKIASNLFATKTNNLTSESSITSLVNALNQRAGEHAQIANGAISFGDTSDQSVQRVYAGIYSGVAQRVGEHIADVGNKVVKKLDIEDVNSYIKEAAKSSLEVFRNASRDEVKAGYQGVKESVTGMFVNALNSQISQSNFK